MCIIDIFIICSNILGSCRGTTGPNSINPKTGKYYGSDFPVVTIKDMVIVQKYLIDHLNIDKLLGVIGGSLGGFQCLEWATQFPDKVEGCLPIASSSRLTTQGLAFDVVARNSIISDPYFNSGNYYENDKKPDVGLALARMLGHITYLSRESMNEKFEIDRNSPRDISTSFEKKFSVGSYLAYQGEKFVRVLNLTAEVDCNWKVIHDNFNENIVYAIFDNHKYGDYKPYVYMSKNKGRTWKSISENLPEDALTWRIVQDHICLLYTSPSPRDRTRSRMPSSA